MAVAVLHDEFTPYGGRGGVCASGEIIIGPGGNTAYVNNRIVVFDPVSKTADTYEVTMAGTVTTVGHGCAFDGGVAMVAGTPSASYGVLIFYPDGTYDVIAFPFGGQASDWALVSDGSTLAAVYVQGSYSSNPQVFTPGVGWSSGSTGFVGKGQPLMSGGVAVGIRGSGDMYSMDMSTGNTTTLHSGVGSPPISGGQMAILGGRLWYPTSVTNLRGVRISDGHVVNIPVPGISLAYERIPLTTDGTHLFVTEPSSVVYQVNPLTFSIVTHTLSPSLGYVFSMHYSGGKVWVPGSTPTS